MSDRVADCTHCGAELTAETGRAFWCKGDLGICVVRVCRAGSCAEDVLTSYRWGPLKRIAPPKSKPPAGAPK